MDGCKAGWFAIAWDGTPHGFEWRVLSGFDQVCEFAPTAKIVAVDIPIGFIADLAGTRVPGVGQDDILDACAACWTARRILNNVAIQIPACPVTDSRGLRMEMWY